MKGRVALLALMMAAGACSDSGSATAPRGVDSTTSTVPQPDPTTTTGPTATTRGTPGTTVANGTVATTTPPASTQPPGPPPSLDDTVLALELIADGFGQPVYLDAPSGDPRLFIVDQPGRIWIIENGQRLAEPFLDINDLVNFSGEMGLLGMAFHPDYATNGRFFVHYTDEGLDTMVAEYAVAADPNLADRASERTILRAPQPAGNHNGGMIAFGADGYLYIALGDGGGADDQFRNGQNLSSLLGTLLRIDIDSGDPYAIPPGNPFGSGQTANGSTAAPEIWAWGLRNPWRFSFDGGLLYIGDVGQRLWEEIDVAPADAPGLNYGWPVMEGLHCFRPSSGCNGEGLVAPVLEYGHGPGCSVAGGFVYRGSEIPQLIGHYFYGDFCSGLVQSFLYDGTAATERRDWTDQVGRVISLTSFGTDAFGELYVMSVSGRVLKLVEA